MLPALPAAGLGNWGPRGSWRRFHGRRHRRKHHRNTGFRRWRQHDNAVQQVNECQQRQSIAPAPTRRAHRIVDGSVRSGADSAKRAMPSPVAFPPVIANTLVSAMRKAPPIRPAPVTTSEQEAGAVWPTVAPTVDRRDTRDRSRYGRADKAPEQHSNTKQGSQPPAGCGHRLSAWREVAEDAGAHEHRQPQREATPLRQPATSPAGLPECAVEHGLSSKQVPAQSGLPWPGHC